MVKTIDRQTDRHKNIQQTTSIMNVYTTIKSLRITALKVDRPRSQNISVTLYRRSKPETLFIHLT